MQLSLTFLTLLGAISTALAAPVNDVANASTLIPRGRIRHQLHLIGEDAQELVCNVKQAVRCFNHDVKQHLHIIKDDLEEDFFKWRADVRADFELLIAELSAEIVHFEVKYAEFKLAVKAAIGFAVGATISAIDWAAYDIRFHLALIWETLGELEVDVREEIYHLLTSLSISIHAEVGVKYTEYPASCTAVLTQIETVQQYYSEQITVEKYQGQLTAIYQKIFAATKTTKTTVSYESLD